MHSIEQVVRERLFIIISGQQIHISILKGAISMGKPTSYLFCRYHDLKSTFFDENGDFHYVLISISLPKYLEMFVQNNPNYSQNNAVLALCSLSSLDDSAESVKYAPYANQFGRDYGTIIETIMRSYNEFDSLLEQKPYDTSIIYLIVFCLGIQFPKDPESNNVACSLLNRVLDMEGNRLTTTPSNTTQALGKRRGLVYT